MRKLFKSAPRTAPEPMLVQVDGEEREVFFTEGETVLQAVLLSGIEISSSCGGMGTCGTCRFYVVEGAETFPVPEDVEKEMAQVRLFAEHERLACQVTAKCGVKIRVP